MIKVDLVTGFLGSGKTTFIKKYVPFLISHNERVGILENDYGAINVDMLLLSELRGDNCELEMVAGGCDRDCYKRRFKTKLISMAMSGYTRVVIEPSGIFDITDFFDVLREEPLDNWYEIGTVFCIVDGQLDVNCSPQTEYVLRTQLCSAGVVIVSRCSYVESDENGSNSIKKELCKLVPGLNDLNIFTKDWNHITDEEFGRLMNSGYHIYDGAKEYDFDDLPFESLYFLECDLSIDQMRDKAEILFSDSLGQKSNVIRVKGFTQTNGQWYELNATKHECVVNITTQGQEVFIVIGEFLDKDLINKIIYE